MSNNAVQEIWEGPMRRSLAQVDGRRRASDVYSIMKPAPDVSADRFRIFPADDPRVLKTVRKIVRGLCHHHGIQSAVKDDQVIADILRHEIPEGLLSGMIHHHVEQDVFEYQFAISERPYAASLWLLRFYERTTFVATAFNSLADKAAFDADTESL